MVTQEEAVRAALELQAQFLDDLGQGEEAAAVRHRVPLRNTTDSYVDASRESQTRQPSDAALTSKAAGVEHPDRTVTAVGSEGRPGGLLVAGPPMASTDSAYVVGDGFRATLHGGGDFSEASAYLRDLISSNPEHFLIWAQAWRAHQDAYPAAGSRLVVPLTEFEREVDLDVLRSVSVNLPLERRLGIYQLLAHGTDDPHVELMHGSTKARYLRLVKNVGNALRVPDSSILYVVSYLLRKRL